MRPGRALDGSVELGTFGRQDEEVEAPDAAGLLEGRLELGAAVELDSLDLDGASAMSLSRSAVAPCAVARVATAPTIHLATGS